MIDVYYLIKKILKNFAAGLQMRGLSTPEICRICQIIRWKAIQSGNNVLVGLLKVDDEVLPNLRWCLDTSVTDNQDFLLFGNMSVNARSRFWQLDHFIKIYITQIEYEDQIYIIISK